MANNPTPEPKEVLEFLKDYHTREEIEKKFIISESQSYHLIKWLENARMIKPMQMRVANKTNRVWYYRAI
jgi:hypothetical protein